MTIESVTDKDGIKRYEQGIAVDDAIADIIADGFDVKSWDQDGNLLEDIRYANDGTCTERKAFEHYTVEPINP